MFHVILVLPRIIAMTIGTIVVNTVSFILGSACLTMGIILKHRGGMKAETIISFSCAVIDYLIIIGVLLHWLGWFG